MKGRAWLLIGAALAAGLVWHAADSTRTTEPYLTDSPVLKVGPARSEGAESAEPDLVRVEERRRLESDRTPRTRVSCYDSDGIPLPADKVTIECEGLAATAVVSNDGQHQIAWPAGHAAPVTVRAFSREGYASYRLVPPFPDDLRVDLVDTTITGHIVFADGEPCGSCELRAIRLGSDEAAPVSMAEQGGFVVGGLAPGDRCSLLAGGPGLFPSELGAIYLAGTEGVRLSVHSLYGVRLDVTDDRGLAPSADPRLLSVGWQVVEGAHSVDVAEDREARLLQPGLGSAAGGVKGLAFPAVLEGPGHEPDQWARLRLDLELPGYSVTTVDVEVPRLEPGASVGVHDVTLPSLTDKRGDLVFTVVGLPWPEYSLAGEATLAAVRLAPPSTFDLTPLFADGVFGVGLRSLRVTPEVIRGIPAGRYRVGLLAHHFLGNAIPSQPEVVDVHEATETHVYFDVSGPGILEVEIEHQGESLDGPLDLVLSGVGSQGKWHRASFVDSPYTLAALPLERFEVTPIRPDGPLPAQIADIVAGQVTLRWEVP